MSGFGRFCCEINGQLPHTDTRLLKNRDRSFSQHVSDLVDICQEKRQLTVRPSLAKLTQQND